MPFGIDICPFLPSLTVSIVFSSFRDPGIRVILHVFEAIVKHCQADRDRDDDLRAKYPQVLAELSGFRSFSDCRAMYPLGFSECEGCGWRRTGCSEDLAYGARRRSVDNRAPRCFCAVRLGRRTATRT